MKFYKAKQQIWHGEDVYKSGDEVPQKVAKLVPDLVDVQELTISRTKSEPETSTEGSGAGQAATGDPASTEKKPEDKDQE